MLLHDGWGTEFQRIPATQKSRQKALCSICNVILKGTSKKDLDAHRRNKIHIKNVQMQGDGGSIPGQVAEMTNNGVGEQIVVLVSELSNGEIDQSENLQTGILLDEIPEKRARNDNESKSMAIPRKTRHSEWDEHIERIYTGARNKARCIPCNKIFSATHSSFLKDHKTKEEHLKNVERMNRRLAGFAVSENEEDLGSQIGEEKLLQDHSYYDHKNDTGRKKVLCKKDTICKQEPVDEPVFMADPISLNGTNNAVMNAIEVPCGSSESSDADHRIKILIPEGDPAQLEMVESLQQFFKPFSQKPLKVNNHVTPEETTARIVIAKDDRQKTLEGIHEALKNLVEIEKKKVVELEKISSVVSTFLQQTNITASTK